VRFEGGWYPLDKPFPGEDETTSTPTPSKLQTPVPMGSVLSTPSPTGRVPGFTVTAMKDPKSANLDRIQIVKGWLDSQGESHERVFDVAWSGSRRPDKDGTVPAVGNTVDTATASYDNTIGAPTLEVIWHDPHFDPAHSAFYYARVLEIPTPRHSLYDAVALGQDAVKKWPSSLQERAYTSPIWYQPHTAP
jgi:hypothetical protein